MAATELLVSCRGIDAFMWLLILMNASAYDIWKVANYQGCYRMRTGGRFLLEHDIPMIKQCVSKCKKEGNTGAMVAAILWCGCETRLTHVPLPLDRTCFTVCRVGAGPSCHCYDKTHSDVPYEDQVRSRAEKLVSKQGPEPEHDACYKKEIKEQAAKKYNDLNVLCPSMPPTFVAMYLKHRRRRLLSKCRRISRNAKRGDKLTPGVNGEPPLAVYSGTGTPGKEANNCQRLCRGKNIKYGFYLAGLSCGCWKSPELSDSALGPVTEACADKVVCMEHGMGVCFCSDRMREPSYSNSSTTISLIYPDMTTCFFHDVKIKPFMFKNRPVSGRNIGNCISHCKQKGRKYAGFYQGHVCGCRKRVTDFNLVADTHCQGPCAAQSLDFPCGGPYTATVYHTNDDPELMKKFDKANLAKIWKKKQHSMREQLAESGVTENPDDADLTNIKQDGGLVTEGDSEDLALHETALKALRAMSDKQIKMLSAGIGGVVALITCVVIASILISRRRKRSANKRLALSSDDDDSLDKDDDNEDDDNDNEEPHVEEDEMNDEVTDGKSTESDTTASSPDLFKINR